MKSRQRFFDPTVLKKDMTRFAPVWILYLVGGIMVTAGTLGPGSNSYMPIGGVSTVNSFLTYFPLVNIGYALLVAQLLFGDLFNARLCNALHAMPLRREGWFLTHMTAGWLFSFLPNLVGSLIFLLFLGVYWYVAFLWLLGMSLQYLFFFGLAVFSMHCTGNRFAAVVIYGIVNFLSLLALWLLETIYVPLLYGIQMDPAPFYVLCPLVSMLTADKYFQLDHVEQCPCGGMYYDYGKNFQHMLSFRFGDGWLYLGILAGLGLVLLMLALLLYRRRKLESAGDFVAFSFMKPIFQVIFTICAAGGCNFIANTIFSLPDSVCTVFLIVGLLVGYFVGKMLLERTVKVFRGRNFLQLGLLVLVCLASLVLTQIDILGITRYVPESGQIEAVYVAQGHYTDRRLENIDNQIRHSNILKATDPATIDRVRDLHQQLIAEGGDDGGVIHVNGNYYGGSQNYTVYYKLKDGRTVARYYSPTFDSEAFKQTCELMSLPKASLGVASLEELSEKLDSVLVAGKQTIPAIVADELLEAIWADAMEGRLISTNLYHVMYHEETEDFISLELTYADPKTGTSGDRRLLIYPCCENTWEYLKTYGSADSILMADPEKLAQEVKCIDIGGNLVDVPSQIQSLLWSLQRDLRDGHASGYLVGYGKQWQEVVVYLRTGESFSVYFNPAKGVTWHWLEDFLGQ